MREVTNSLQKRYMHLGHAMVYKYANANTDFGNLQKYSLATKEELALFNEHNSEDLPAMVFGWAMRSMSSPLLFFPLLSPPLPLLFFVVYCIVLNLSFQLWVS